MMATLDLICAQWQVSVDGATPRGPVEISGVTRSKEFPILLRDAGFKVGVEVGVEQGLYSECLCQLIPGLNLAAVDCWTAHRGYRDHVSQAKLDGFYDAAKKRLAPYDCTLIREWSVDAAKLFDDGSLDFVYIDGNHDFANVVKDIHAWSPKVRKGGVISGHDFRQRKNPIAHHVVEAVKSYTACYNIVPWFVLGRRARRDGEPRDKNRSWMWVR